MAKIYLNIEAESALDLQEALLGLVSSNRLDDYMRAGASVKPIEPIEPWVPKNVTKQMYGTFREDADNESVTASSTVTAPLTSMTGAIAEIYPTDNLILDAHGHPWSADLHASTKTQTKDGLWRMKPGVERPAPAAGYPKTETARQGGEDAPIGDRAADEGASSNLTPVEKLAVEASADADEDDELAQWAAMATKPEPEAPAREWADADMAKLTNQAAKALVAAGKDVGEIKKLIEVYSAIGTVPHSRNIPVEDRERFAGEVEVLAGITYEG